MTLSWQIAVGSGWIFSLLLGFLLLGALRRFDRLSWQLEQMRATTPRRLGRDGLSVGRKAPDFTLPSVLGSDVSLRDFLGERVLLVFAQVGCSPCRGLTPALRSLHGNGMQVVNVYSGKLDSVRRWVESQQIRFPVLVQDSLDVSKRYEAYATPFAFVVNEQGIIAARGFATTAQHVDFLLADARDWERRIAEGRETESVEPSEEAESGQRHELVAGG